MSARECVCCGVNLRKGWTMTDKGEGTKTAVGWLCVVCHEKACRMYVVIRNEFFTLRVEGVRS